MLTVNLKVDIHNLDLGENTATLSLYTQELIEWLQTMPRCKDLVVNAYETNFNPRKHENNNKGSVQVEAGGEYIQ